MSDADAQLLQDLRAQVERLTELAVLASERADAADAEIAALKARIDRADGRKKAA